MLTQQDYNDYIYEQVTPVQLAEKYSVSLQTVYRHLNKYRTSSVLPPKRRLNPEEVSELRYELKNAIPHDSERNVTAIIRRWGISSVANACRLVGVKNLSQLRTGNSDLNQILRKLHLRLVGNVLYSPQKRGRSNERLQLFLGEDALGELYLHPTKWIKDNLTEIKTICFGKNTKGGNEND